MDIHIEEDRGTILIKQKWKYSWFKEANASEWTYLEKQKFHKEIDNIIWNSWGAHFFLKVTGTSDFAKRNEKTRWDVNFDIQWVTNSEHWEVNVTKYASDYTGNPTSSVRWNSRIIKLDTKDTSWRKRVRNQKKYYQYPISHEFGHTVGNSIYASSGMHGDEYSSTSSYLSDKHSLMNIGNNLRDRHLDFIISQLNLMLPNSNFSKY